MLQFKLIRANVLKKMVLSLENVGAVGTLYYTASGLLLQNSEAFPHVVAVCELDSWYFEHFSCDRDVIAGVGLNTLASALAVGDDDDSITVRITNDGVIDLYFEDTTGQYRTRHSESYTVGVPYNHRSIDKTQYEYQVIVGIPSDGFREIYESLRGSADRVCILITDEEVEFNTRDFQAIITKERNECIIGGAEEDTGLYTMVFHLHHMCSFLDASELSDTVWLLWSPNAPPLLTCLVTHCLLGDIKFYFF